MQQTQVTVDQSICHAQLQTDQTLCGLAYFSDSGQQDEIVKESLRYYRLMTFFKNYNYDGHNDLLLIYLWVVSAHMFKTIENDQSEIPALRKLEEIAREAIPRNNDKKNFLGGLMKDIPGQNDKLQVYLKQLKDVLAKQIIALVYVNGQRTFESKFWTGISKRKFMGMSYTGQ